MGTIPRSQYISSFLASYSLEKRKSQVEAIRNTYPDRIPIVIDRAPNTQIAEIKRHKFLVPSDITVSKFLYEILKHIEIDKSQSLFIFINNFIPPAGALVMDFYEKHKAEDGFLYVLYAGENTFGAP